MYGRSIMVRDEGEYRTMEINARVLQGSMLGPTP